MKKLSAVFLLSIFLSSLNFVAAQVPGVKWSKFLRYIDYNWAHVFFDMQPTSDKGFIMVGESGYGFTSNSIIGKASFVNGNGQTFIIKTDSAGNIMWRKVILPPTNNCAFNSVVETKDGGYLAVGHLSVIATDISQLFLTKYSSQGSELWRKTYGGSLTHRMQLYQLLRPPQTDLW